MRITRFDFLKKKAHDEKYSPTEGMGKHFTNMTSNETPDDWRAFLRMAVLNQAFDKAFIQKERIERGMESSNLTVLFADIHFFLVAVTNIQYALLSVKSVLKSNVELNAIYKKYIEQLEHLNVFRDHLEHITDRRIDGLNKKGERLKNPGMLGNLFGTEYDFGGERFNLKSAFGLVEDIFRELKEWNRKVGIFPLWGGL